MDRKETINNIRMRISRTIDEEDRVIIDFALTFTALMMEENTRIGEEAAYRNLFGPEGERTDCLNDIFNRMSDITDKARKSSGIIWADGEE